MVLFGRLAGVYIRCTFCSISMLKAQSLPSCPLRTISDPHSAWRGAGRIRCNLGSSFCATKRFSIYTSALRGGDLSRQLTQSLF